MYYLGAQLRLISMANKELSSAWMVLNNDRINLNVNKTNIFRKFKTINEIIKCKFTV